MRPCSSIRSTSRAIAAGIEQAIAQREELRARGLERGRAFSWDERARGCTQAALRARRPRERSARRDRRRRPRPPAHRRRDVRREPAARTARRRRGPPLRRDHAPTGARAARHRADRAAGTACRSCAWRFASHCSCAGCGPRSRTSCTRCRSRFRARGADRAGSLVRAGRVAHGRRETAIFRFVVPRSARRARARVRDLGADEGRSRPALRAARASKVVVTPLAADPAFRPGGTRSDYVLLSGSIEARKNPLLAADAAAAAGRRLVVAGPERDARARGRAARAWGRRARLRLEGRARAADPGGRGAALSDAARRLRPARGRGDGLRHAGRRDAGSGGARGRRRRRRIRRAGASSRRRSRACSPIRSRGRAPASSVRGAVSWDRTAQITVDVYREVLA